MKVYKLEILVTDHEDIGREQIVDLVRDQEPLFVQLLDVQEREIGEWDDSNPLNSSVTVKAECERLFGI